MAAARTSSTLCRIVTVSKVARPASSAFRVAASSSNSRASTSTLPPSVREDFIARRLFSTSLIRGAERAKLIKDPNHPSEVYYHRLEDSNRYAISFLEQPPSSSHSPSIIAYVDYPESSQTAIYEHIRRKPDAVETNTAFISLLHETMKKECVPQDGLIEYEAALRGSGWAHLNDQRHPLMPGRIATPENIIASVAFIDGELRPDSYEANDVYRVVTGEEGFMDLRPTWLMFIKKRCEEVN